MSHNRLVQGNTYNFNIKKTKALRVFNANIFKKVDIDDKGFKDLGRLITFYSNDTFIGRVDTIYTVVRKGKAVSTTYFVKVGKDIISLNLCDFNILEKGEKTDILITITNSKKHIRDHDSMIDDRVTRANPTSYYKERARLESESARAVIELDKF